ncbi:MAG: 2-C-methyl-D-erythritol 4-phosphate cytidylyltransferase [Acidimicrobiia bacterium]|nr:2-C-methyl-D-erythritol 4-phosphate cytidylyltransferase [Acidimicrobiia bacterium]
MSVWAVVVGGGMGIRYGTVKQYEQLGDKRVLDWALEAARAVAEGVVLVVPADRAGETEHGVDAVVAGGATRPASVRAGLAAVPGDAEVIVVHDAARPLASVGLFELVIEQVRNGADAAIPGLQPADTIKRVDGDVVLGTVDRQSLAAVQTPQAFAAAVLRRAHEGDPEATDDAALVEAIGGRVVLVPGEEGNAKITSPHDLVVARALINHA